MSKKHKNRSGKSMQLAYYVQYEQVNREGKQINVSKSFHSDADRKHFISEKRFWADKLGKPFFVKKKWTVEYW